MATVQDTFEIKEDGSGLMTKKFMIIDDSLIDKWIISSQGDPSVNRWQLETDFYKLYPAKCTSLSSISNVLASTLNTGSFNSAQVKAGIVYAHTNKTIGVSTEKTISSIEQFKEWFRGQLIIYELDIPIVTHIAKEIMPSILIHKNNILDVGGAVKPSSFKVTVPTTDGIKKEYTLTPINGWKGTAKANLLQTGDIGLVLDLTIPSSFNASVCSLATELRPKAERTVLGYNGNTPVVVKIGTDGTVKLPVTATGVVKLDDTYKL